MKAIVTFDPEKLSEKTLKLILAKASEWACSPEIAMERLLDELASKSRKSKPAPPLV